MNGGWGRRVVGLGMVALAMSALAAFALPSAPMGAVPPPVKPRLPQTGQNELLVSGIVPVELSARRAARVRVSLRARRGKSRDLLARVRTVRMRRGRKTVLLRLSPSGVRSLSDCRDAGLTVTVSRGRARRSQTRPLRLEPPRCARFFGDHTFWNTPLSDSAPLDANSAAITGDLLRQVDQNYRSGRVPTVNTTAYSAPVYTVPSRQPEVRVHLDKSPGLAPDLARAFARVPIPDGAQPAAGTDGSMVVWQPSTDTMWEFWGARLDRDGWHARWGGRLERVTHGEGRFVAPHAGWGATATSLPLAGGLITASELRRGRIDHALAMAIPEPRAGTFARPAQRTDGFSTRANSVPEGARFRLDPKIDLDAMNLPRPVLAMARAAQRYGMFVRDKAGVVVLYAEDPVTLGADPYPAIFGPGGAGQALKSFPWWGLRLTKMELVEQPRSDWPPCVLACP